MAGLPSITGWHQEVNHHDSWDNSGAFTGTRTSSFNGTAKGTDYGNRGFCTISFDASRSSSIYGSSDTVTPLSLSCKFIISY